MNRKNRKIVNPKRRKKYHNKHKKNNKIKNLQENIANKAKEYINDENIQKIKDTAGKSFEKAKNFTSENIDKFQKYLDEQDFKGKIQNIANAGMDKIKEHSKKKYISRFLIFLHKHYILNFSILFIIAILVFRNIYITHNREIEKNLNYSITNYAPSLDNIIVAKEDYYTNMIIRQISSNKTATNNIILKSSSINDLETSLKNVLDNYNRNLETSLNETIKSSNRVINFWFAFLSVIIIIFTLVGIIINNRIIKTSKKRISKFNREYNKRLNTMKKQVMEFKKLKKESENNLQINSLYNLANTAFDNKDYNTSISYYNKVLELNNSFIHAIYNRAIAYYYVNNHTKCAFELITLYNNNKSNEIKNLILKNIIELANDNIEIAILFCDNENIDYKSLQQKEEKQSLFERIKNIIS
ncbi:hypothetical protein SZ47_11085 [Brachyspira hyodysenteriae]|uniref:Uncharacterized protein n=1 Tax=Brachyspira hyodysenteriae ATCC 27164 TaxID=1266923 RepID=A0A3B6W0S3_BRAHO|nr:hypothetical protein [Brachyspira hyodysenteriae]ANN64760.1 hypothetical protein BHYOB78_13095 [Brachyspira hyodysenteriae ATCC 27164]KLI14997.1 hypothetical protein SU45_10665 [Brachyspira hyodysenteriae]KLI23553.1 hypothetical protein SZ47_11085 [Brachyspira hyodysenteriae]KLI62207.1 hypothetical protein SZ46_02855 [Brachyspira hyodysenteriae]MCZ9924069.1 hypothetical protein [Brachyspira hyodysenteriae]